MTNSGVERFYRRIAPRYDLLATAPVVRRWRETAVEALDLSPGDTVVEMGCGTGANFPPLRERVGSEGRVVGIDRTQGMLAQARDRVERAGWANVSLVRGDATSPPVEAADAVLGSFVVGLLDDPGAAVDRWLDVLEPGGRIAILEAGRSDRSAALPLNLAFRAFVRASSPGGLTRWRSPARQLDRKIAAAQDALVARTVDRRHEAAALGLVGVTSGRSPVDSP
ncbi:class I SAM-dependent methyltransferase [Halapricum desulfuricans]|uniref:SAM-dependent methyltransferase n=1 Tax=Halapricum desulfuricans TaxID=2841257 RepID=A0A897NN02_9EURY|nr:methyltransferase domain-containing protein [Halapricum desulfuricans]QSG14127.1 SAM-dependent methyltransferase [Halapricum desulfuricans]